MNERLKYRVFGKESSLFFKGMHEVKYFSLNKNNSEYITLQTEDVYNKFVNINTIILMQYIGRKDDNNILIYEDDLISDGIDILRVIWDESTLSFMVQDLESLVLYQFEQLIETKIIGNI